MQTNRFVLAGTGSGVGKTTFTIGLMKALQEKGKIVQGFKCGPDYIDPTYHTAVTGRVSRNIDSWMFSHGAVCDIVARASKDADVSIIEGVMGFYDGKSPLSDAGSAADISVVTESPVILIVNCASMARSVAAVVKGFQLLSDQPNIVGVIANQVGSVGHYEIAKAAIEQECGIPVIGYLKREQGIDIPSRHLGLVPAIERGELDTFFDKLGSVMAETIDLELLLELTKAPVLQESGQLFAEQPSQNICIAVAKDAAFNFYYEENLALLRAKGAKLQFFSPLANEPVPPDADGLYIGGGFPEEFADILAENSDVKKSIREAVTKGLPTLAECGGFMYLTEAITNSNGDRYDMVGVIPGEVAMQTKLAALGYREIFGTPNNFLIGTDEEAKGHEFHYSKYNGSHDTPAYETKGRFGNKQEGYQAGNLVAGYTHFHFVSNPKLVDNWLTACKKVKNHD
ncbi:cobyrinic acid a,c-diamide synthase [Lysinibacillus sphaericus]|uniref:cobyrinate a,c-diamide synthase n=1 Tax=Lysinibacillus sphaericus TaxID=1421 RepID=UPI0018CF10DF|nr:cobyrinate a,c-diamide synthase [Lysinibacillus sphaericus]MBG9454955.1 cobyrinic acid a,c-diamide synthase [Lysinibacillus sphaericus]MBG9478974.1 cobyrinic acid a,c-diamide synthase [Lysinibacillus sphaericus]MBG9593330.1 cobyrinic acid a,c-diamide synthase [Lysinibacillus sphaericus]